MPGSDVREIGRQAILFEKRLNEIKESLAPLGIDWYPYRTLTIFPILDKVLTGPRRHLLDLAAGDPILDVGCGDGALSFFLESMGYDVRAIDGFHTNHNSMRGFTELRTALKSSVPVEVIDLDSQFRLSEEAYGLVMFLGILYHLKNPYYVLEALAGRARYCVLSTRIAQQTPAGTSMKDEPLAYLLDPSESNDDATNYWIFSEAALRRLFHRTGWDVLDFNVTGVESGSEPARLDRDQRAFCLLKSRICPHYWVKLLEGWHPLEQSSFRWTEGRFSVELKRPPLVNLSTFRFDFRLTYPGPVTLNVKVSGVDLAAATYSGEGDHSYVAKLPRRALKEASIRIDFEADRCLPGGTLDERELALLVVFWKPGLETADALLPFQLA
ncbi:MAG TPA: methyltransferase domain-containing protein [Bryobacteraceae bacterium]